MLYSYFLLTVVALMAAYCRISTPGDRSKMATAMGRSDFPVVGQMLQKAWSDKGRLFSQESLADDGYADISSEYDGMSTKRPCMAIDLDSDSMDVGGISHQSSGGAYGSAVTDGLDL
jgi:hypothetical protein